MSDFKQAIAAFASKGGFERKEATCPKHGTFYAFMRPTDKPEDVCPMCARERERAKDEAFMKARMKAEFEGILTGYGVPEIFLESSFSNYETHNKQLAEMKAIVQGVATGSYRTATLIGTPGIGKTHLMCAAIAEYARQGKTARYITESELVREIKATYNKTSKDTEAAIIDRYVEPQLLCIDELRGTEWAQWEGTVIADIIDRRYQRIQKKTILAGNISIEQLKSHFEDRTISRLQANGEIYCCLSEDYRKSII